MSTTQLRSDIRDLQNKAHSLKTKAAKKKVWGKISALERQLYSELSDIAATVHGKTLKGIVLYTSTGSFLIQVSSDDLNTTVHAFVCNAVNSASWYSETSCITAHKGQEVEFTLIAEVYNEGIALSAAKIKGLTFDKAQYDVLSKNKNLAFFRYDLSNTEVTGLFA